MLTEKVEASAKFIPKLTDKCRPFFQALYSKGDMEQNQTQATAFKALKDYLSSSPILTALKPGGTLFLYFSISKFAVSFVMFLERENIQRPVYYVSKVL